MERQSHAYLHMYKCIYRYIYLEVNTYKKRRQKFAVLFTDKYHTEKCDTQHTMIRSAKSWEFVINIYSACLWLNISNYVMSLKKMEKMASNDKQYIKN